jgi:uncharacterized membrane protein
MSAQPHAARLSAMSAIFNVLDPIQYGFFVATLVFDVIYFNTAIILWVKGAAWLVTLGLLFAIVPQLINLAAVWFSKRVVRSRARVIDFWLNLVAILAAIVNAFVHSRDAYAVMPDGVWLSVVTVLAMAIGKIVLSGERTIFRGVRHEQA